MSVGAARAALRSEARALLALTPPFAEMTGISAWFQVTDATPLPAYGLAVPGTNSDRFTHETSQHVHQLVVVIKRTCLAEQINDLEDQLDADVDAAAEALCGSGGLRTEGRDIELSQIATAIDRSGGQPVGTLTLNFTVTAWI